jgi:hypothetical protein
MLLECRVSQRNSGKFQVWRAEVVGLSGCLTVMM